MAQVLVRNLEVEVVERLKARARQHGRSLQAEAREILQEAAAAPSADWRKLLADLDRKLAGRTFSDSSALIREDRDSR